MSFTVTSVSFPLLFRLPEQVLWVIGGILILLGLSFCYKFWTAAVTGRCYYWSGFLPLTIISPWFIHLPPGKNSLIKQREGMLCHIIIGPLFFVSAVFCLMLGCDLVGLPGSKAVNIVLSGGDETKPATVVWEPGRGYRFPVMGKASKKIKKIFNKQINLKDDQKLLHQRLNTHKGVDIKGYSYEEEDE